MTSKMIMGAAAAALSFLALSGAASAASVTFSDFTSTNEDQLNPTVTITEDGNDFDVMLDLASGEFGNLTTFYLAADGNLGCGSLTNLSTGFTSCTDDPSTITGDGSINPLNDDYDFDLAFTFRQTGSNKVDVALPFSFTISDPDDNFALGDFEAIGLRFKSSSNAEGSDKLVGTPDMTPIPLPAAGWMLLAGLGGLAAARRRNN